MKYAIFVLLFALAGCASDPNQHDPATDIELPTTDPASLPAPPWVVGKSWSYRTDGGLWHNYTVENIEDYRDWRTYVVRVQYSQPDPEQGAQYDIRWIDSATMGVVRGEMGSMSMESDVPAPQWLPATDRDYHASFNAYGYDFETEFGLRVGAWESVETGMGPLASLKLDILQEGELSHELWYNPDLGVLTKIREYLNEEWTTFVLQSA